MLIAFALPRSLLFVLLAGHRTPQTATGKGLRESLPLADNHQPFWFKCENRPAYYSRTVKPIIHITSGTSAAMFISPLVAISLLAGVAVAKPVALRDTDCSPIASGILAANATGVYKAFTLNLKNQVAYFGDGQNPLRVEFQECQSLEVGLPHDIVKAGRVYVPSKSKCIGITNQQAPTGPYYTTLVDCGTNYPQRWALDTGNNNALRWAGESDEEGTILQGGCGLLGYKSHNKGVPTITHSNNQITIECTGTAFRMVSSAS